MVKQLYSVCAMIKAIARNILLAAAQNCRHIAEQTRVHKARRNSPAENPVCVSQHVEIAPQYAFAHSEVLFLWKWHPDLGASRSINNLSTLPVNVERRVELTVLVRDSVNVP